MKKKKANQNGYFYYVNEQKGVVTCKYNSCGGTWIGISRCDPNDEFNEEFGKELARKRAVLASKKDKLASIFDTYDTCTIRNISNAYYNMLKSIDKELLYASQIQTLESEIKNMY